MTQHSNVVNDSAVSVPQLLISCRFRSVPRHRETALFNESSHGWILAVPFKTGGSVRPLAREKIITLLFSFNSAVILFT